MCDTNNSLEIEISNEDNERYWFWIRSVGLSTNQICLR